MSDAYNDPSANTAQFKAFVAEPEPQSASSRVGVIVGAVVAVVVVAAGIAWLAL